MSYLYKRVILTKDNLARRQWQGDRKSCLCSTNKAIQHLLFDYHFAKFIWRIVHISFNLKPPTSVYNLFIGWFGLNRKLKSQILVVARATCIVLIPKVQHPGKLKDFRPISLCNVIYKVISKCIVNRPRPLLQYPKWV
jgi:hypothetical protein